VYAQNKMTGVHVRRLINFRRTIWRTTTLHYFHYDLCFSLINQEVYPSLVVNHSIYTLAYLLVGFIVSSMSEIMPKIGTLGVRQKSIPPAYHMPKNRPPGISTPNSKILTEALVSRGCNKVNLSRISGS